MTNENNAVLQLLDVLRICYQGNTQNIGKERTFCAVSLRKRTKTTIKSNGKTWKICDHSLTFIPANVPYYRQSEYDDMIVLHFNSSVVLFDSICTIVDFDYENVSEKFEKALSIWRGYDPDKYYRVSAILYEIIAVFYKNANRTHYSEAMQNAMTYVKENIGNPNFSVNDIAAHLNICPTTLRNLFRRELGCSPKQYLIRTRMTEAVWMINSGYWSVTQIANHVGYYDQKNFSTAFKNYYGYSPSKQKYNYRNNE